MYITIRNILISLFVVVWLGVFHYESLRAFYLNPFFKRELPKLKFLYPPAGWIMFYKVDDRFGNVEVYGIKGDQPPQLIDPHKILQTRAIGYDNIHRGALLTILSPGIRQQACSYLHRKFEYFEKLLVVYVEYPSLSKEPLRQERHLVYRCE